MIRTQLRSHGFGALPHQADFQYFFKFTVSSIGILEYVLWQLGAIYRCIGKVGLWPKILRCSRGDQLS